MLGGHDGQHNFTVGQRRGLGISGGEPLYVLSRDAEANRVVVGPRERLATSSVPLEGVRLHRGRDAVETVRLRYHAAPIACSVTPSGGDGGRALLELERPALAAAPGQLACLMSDDRVVGYGTIGEPA